MAFCQIAYRRWLAGLWFICSMTVSAQTVTVTSFPTPTANSGPSSITVGPDGALWFTEFNTSKVGRITTAGAITEFPTGAPSGLCGAQITTGPDGNLWATFGNAPGPGTMGTVIRMNTAGTVTGTFATPQPNSCAASITSGPDGALWLGQQVAASDTIGRLTTSGSFTNEFPIPPGGGPQPMGITTGQDGALWFTEFSAFRIGRMTTSGSYSYYLLPGITFDGTSYHGPTNDQPWGITAGPDGALWFTEFGGNRIGRITTSGTFTEFAIPTAGAHPVSITVGPDGALWFTEANKLGRITTDGTITEFPVSGNPGIIVTGPDGALWFTQGGSNSIGRATPSVCTFALTTSSASIPAGGGTGSFNFTASGDSCAWTATPSPSFISITSATSGTGSGSVNFSVAANTGAARSGTITVGGQTFTINQAAAPACMFTLTPTSASSPIGGGAGSFGITASDQSCAWSAASNNSFVMVTSGANGTGNGTVNYTVAVNSGAPRSGTITAAGLTFTVNQAGVAGACARFPSQGGTGPATLLVSPSTLNFGINGGSVTGPQNVTLIFSNAGGSIWTAISNRSNIVVSPTTGSGSGAFQVTVSVTPGPSGTITVTSAGATNSPRMVQVNVANVGNPTPFGSFDTPVNNAINISGAIPVGGWALDSVEILKVDIWREKIGNEDVRPNGLVYIGDAMFVPGARPDVQAAFPTLPFNTRAGWGYALLTAVLPNNGGSPGPGNGTYVLHAIAHDRAGLATDLGARTITVDNAHATKPFGTIDTPTQSDSVTGTAYQNFGWALTPLPNSIATDGSTITVQVDGVAIGHPTYNQFRSDVANLFPSLMNAKGAVGYFCIDTTTIPNGLHTISWTVFDNANNGEGIGSRYFTVLNSSALTVAAPEEPTMGAANRVAELPVLEPNNEEVQTIQPDDLGRIQFEAGAATGYLLANGERTPLPVGSALVDGVFYWQPAAGFLGDYNLIFERSDGSSVLVRAVVGGNR